MSAQETAGDRGWSTAGPPAAAPQPVAATAPARPSASFEWSLPIDDLRAQVIAKGGRLAQALRRVQRLDVQDEQLADLWRWSAYLTHVRGYRAASTVALYVEVVAAPA